MSETIYTASNETLLNQEIAEINTASATAAPGSSYVIDITSDFGLSSNITAISLAAGTSLEITGNNPSPEGNPTAQLDGNTNHRGFVVLSGAVTLDSLSLINMRASGGNGGNGAAPGGGGAGLAARCSSGRLRR